MSVNNFIKIVLVAAISMLLCGCPMLDFKIYIRNTTSDTTGVELYYKPMNDEVRKIDTTVVSRNELLDINNNTFKKLNEKLKVISDSKKIALKIPPKSTVFVSDLIKSAGIFSDKTLVINTGKSSDTMRSNYSYKQLKDIKRKRDKSYNYFYRTIIYYDIR